ncbi:MAG TPA: histidine kinase [Actinomycetota bacterium]|nr:histidine kinase [Actinomycetota bacterium]
MTDPAIARPAGRPRRWPWIALGIFFCLAGIGIAGIVANDESLAEQAPFIVAFAMFAVVGATILSRAPRNRIGALLLYGSGITASAFVGGEVMTFLVDDGTTSGPLVLTAAVFSNVGWILGIVPVLFFLPLLFPDGRLPSPRWRPLAWLNAATIGFVFMVVVFGEPRLTGSVESVAISNPLQIVDVEPPEAVFTALLLICLGGSVASLVVRFRRASGVERQQIKWVVASLVFLLLSFVASNIASAVGGSGLIDTFVSGAAFIALPVAIGISVLQYRLFDLDVVVKKTLIAGSLVLLVVAVYGTLVWLFGASTTDGGTSVWYFLVPLLLGIAFRPVMRLSRKVADRLVYGRRATPYEVLTEFSERVGDAYATDDILGRMAQILGQGVGASIARVWLLVGAELRAETTWPSDAPSPPAVAMRADRLPDLPGQTVVEVRDRGELLGALSVAMPPSDPMTPAKEKLVRDLAAQAGLVLRNVRLVEELRASQRRIVAAQDQERRRIERNIHDGAQQQLVALAVKARLARQLAERDPIQAVEVLSQIEAETQTALEDLRDLARGIYPPLLADKGLPAALEAQARKSPVPVDVDADGVGRLPQDVEGAVYFSVLEALQNVAKYADATRASVRLRIADGDMTFEVEDDGNGFDASSTGYGTGLQGIADRLAALEGDLEVRSAPNEGTVLTGHVPLGGA